MEFKPGSEPLRWSSDRNCVHARQHLMFDQPYTHQRWETDLVSEFIVRRATADDARGIVTVRVHSWQAGYRGLVPAAYSASMSINDNAERTERYLQSPNQSTQWVCIADTKTIGWASIYTNDRSLEGANNVVELNALYVLPEYWGSGAGFALWSTIANTLVNGDVDEVILWVLAHNQRAINFYERQGFIQDGTTKTEHLNDDIALSAIGMRYGLAHPSL